MQQYEVIIIGAGISGIGASKVLTTNGIPHIIIESQDRYGGRIFSSKFGGLMVDMGATFIHNPNRHNQIVKFVESSGIETVEASEEEEYYYQGIGKLEDDVEERVEQLYNEAYESIQKKAEHSQHDISIGEALVDFIDEDLDGEEPCVRDTVLWKLNIEGNIEGAQLNELSAWKPSAEEKKKDKLALGGGYPMIFQKLYQTCKTKIHYNTKVQAIDYSSDLVRVYTTNGQFAAKRVISSLPLGVLQRGKVQFIPNLPVRYLTAIKSIGNGNENKLFCLFRKPFWEAEHGYINFVTKMKSSKYPIGFVYPNNKGKHILLIFVAGKTAIEIGEWSDQKILQDVREFLSQFVEPSAIQLEEVKLTKWHKDEHSLGSYCYNKVGTTKQHFQQLRKPLDSKVWFVGEHTHPKLLSYAHGAYETGIWAGNEVTHEIKGVHVIEEEESEGS